MEQTLNNKHLQRHTNLEDSNGIEGNGFVGYRLWGCINKSKSAFLCSCSILLIGLSNFLEGSGVGCTIKAWGTIIVSV